MQTKRFAIGEKSCIALKYIIYTRNKFKNDMQRLYQTCELKL